MGGHYRICGAPAPNPGDLNQVDHLLPRVFRGNTPLKTLAPVTGFICYGRVLGGCLPELVIKRNRSLKVSCVSVVYGFDVALILTSPSAVSFSNGTGRLGFI